MPDWYDFDFVWYCWIALTVLAVILAGFEGPKGNTDGLWKYVPYMRTRDVFLGFIFWGWMLYLFVKLIIWLNVPDAFSELDGTPN